MSIYPLIFGTCHFWFGDKFVWDFSRRKNFFGARVPPHQKVGCEGLFGSGKGRIEFGGEMFEGGGGGFRGGPRKTRGGG
jgi:hypothetical protein